MLASKAWRDGASATSDQNHLENFSSAETDLDASLYKPTEIQKNTKHKLSFRFCFFQIIFSFVTVSQETLSPEIAAKALGPLSKVHCESKPKQKLLIASWHTLSVLTKKPQVWTQMTWS